MLFVCKRLFFNEYALFLLSNFPNISLNEDGEFVISGFPEKW